MNNTFKNLLGNKNETTNKWANVIKFIAIATMIITALIGTVIGALIGNSIGDEIYAIIGGAIGLVVGAIIGVIAMSIIMFLSELGKNTRITAEATINSNKVSETDQIIIYKDLLDSGAITQEEFDKKKKELLNL